MFYSANLTATVDISPVHFTFEAIRAQIFAHLVESKCGMVFHESGSKGVGRDSKGTTCYMIVEIERVVSEGKPVILRNGFFRVRCEYQALVFAPVVGMSYRQRITLVIPHGIVIQQSAKVKIVIPPTKLTAPGTEGATPLKFRFNPVVGGFTNDLITYRTGDEIEFTIVSFREQNGEIQCAGSAISLNCPEIPLVTVTESSEPALNGLDKSKTSGVFEDSEDAFVTSSSPRSSSVSQMSIEKSFTREE